MMRSKPIPFLLFIILFLISACYPTGIVETGESSNSSPTPRATAVPSGNSSSTPEPDPTTAAAAPDLSGETITLYQIADRTSSLAGFTSPQVNGVADMVDWTNRQGGIYGAEIAIVHYETNGSVDEGELAFESISEEFPEALAVLVYDPWLAERLAPLAKEAKIPVITTSASESALFSEEEGYVFSLSPTFSDQTAQVVTYLFKNWDEIQPVDVDTVNLALFHYPATYGQPGLIPPLADYFKTLGVNIVYDAEIPYAYTIDLTNEVVEASTAGANLIISEMGGFGTARLMDDLDWVALRQSILLAGTSESMNTSFRGFILDQDHATGALSAFHTAQWGDAGHLGIELAFDLLVENQRTTSDKTVSRLVSQAGIDLIRELLQGALLETELDDLNGEMMFELLTQPLEYDAMDGVVSFTLGPDVRAPQNVGILILSNSIEVFEVLLPPEPVPSWK